jgi:sterol desaturase/sphingolipid hydroxylase (fatty acid hydroxylase superfamily)
VCEIGFWVVLGAGLVARYLLGAKRVGAALLVGVPVVDLVLLVLTVVDLRSGAAPRFAHGLAAAYLGFSVVFGHALVRAADVRFAHRFAGGPAPAAPLRPGTAARMRRAWQGLGKTAVAVLLAALLLLGALALVPGPGTREPLLDWFSLLGLVLVVSVLDPAWYTVRYLVHRVR